MAGMVNHAKNETVKIIVFMWYKMEERRKEEQIFD